MKTRSARLFLTILAVVLLHGAHAQADLFAAAQSGTVADIAVALAQGADVQAANDEGDTPLLVAVQHNTSDVIEALLDAGADPQYKNPQTGYTIFALAARNPDSSSVFALFSEHQLVARVDGRDIADRPAPTLTETTQETAEPAPKDAGPAYNPNVFSRALAEERGFLYLDMESDLTRREISEVATKSADITGITLTADAYANACDNAVVERLKSPASAIFEARTTVDVLADGIFFYRRTLHSQNGFGALIPTHYTCVGFLEENRLTFYIPLP